MACESFEEHLVGFSILLTTKVVHKIFPNLSVVGHLAVPGTRVLACQGWLFFMCLIAVLNC